LYFKKYSSVYSNKMKKVFFMSLASPKGFFENLRKKKSLHKIEPNLIYDYQEYKRICVSKNKNFKI